MKLARRKSCIGSRALPSLSASPRPWRVTCLLLAAAVAQSARAEPALTDLAARVELRAIETVTLSDQQFLSGDKNGKLATVTGMLRFPRSAAATVRVPAVILQHGSGGVGTR